MNAVEIEEAISQLAEQPFNAAGFPFAFLEAFGNKPTTIKRLKSGNSNNSDIPGGLLQRNNIHMAVCGEGEVPSTLASLRSSPATTRARAKFILATDGQWLEAEDLASGETIACPYPHFPDHFGFFLALAGISTVREIRNNPIDIKATARLNRLYVELLKDNPDWATDDRRHDMNQFMARLIFCFFAEDTGLFNYDDLFTTTIEQMTDAQSENTREVLGVLFRAMDTEKRDGLDLPRWATKFPWVNGGLFEGRKEIPKFSRIARSYLLHAGRLNWQQINPDIFGSMIQAVADDSERGELGMHYTSVPNILKVLGPLFLDELHEQLEQAGDNPRKLLNLRKRVENIRVFDPACGSGNFLVIAYIRLREIEAEIYKRRNEPLQRSRIKLNHFYGIEIKDFAVEVARLSLLIAEFQCDVRLIGPKEAKILMLPLRNTGQIRCGNALRLDWLEVCPPPESDEVETYICGNPPYLGSTWQNKQQKTDLKAIFDSRTNTWKTLDYVAGWFMKAADYSSVKATDSAFVSTNSICQGQQVQFLWPLIFDQGIYIHFAHSSFKWTNLASNKAGVTVVIVGLKNQASLTSRYIYSINSSGQGAKKEVSNISAYLVPSDNIIVKKVSQPLSNLPSMDFGNKADDGGYLTFSPADKLNFNLSRQAESRFIRRFYGSKEFINGVLRYCLWVEDHDKKEAYSIPILADRIDSVEKVRLASKDAYANKLASKPHQFKSPKRCNMSVIVTPRVSSENREYLPVGLLGNDAIVGDRNFALYDASLWTMALIASRLHWVWIGTVCVRMRTDFSYSNTLGWNTFPVPQLTEKNKADLTRCAEDILLAREMHFPATIAELYDPEKMPENLRHAHERNDEVLERIYIGRRFKNDTERLEKLFELYSKMTADAPESQKRRKQHHE